MCGRPVQRGSRRAPEERHRRPGAGFPERSRARGPRPPWTPGTVPSETRAILTTQGKRPRWLLDLVKFSFNQTRLIIDSKNEDETRIKSFLPLSQTIKKPHIVNRLKGLRIIPFASVIFNLNSIIIALISQCQ